MTDPLVGTTVAHYEVLGKLGGGGVGVVYTARNVRLGQIVALKFLPPQWSHDESAKQRFLREAQPPRPPIIEISASSTTSSIQKTPSSSSSWPITRARRSSRRSSEARCRSRPRLKSPRRPPRVWP